MAGEGGEQSKRGLSLQIQPVDFAEACDFIKAFHRHHRPPLGAKLQVGVNDGVKLVGVIIAGRPVARILDDGVTLEVTRCCTDGTRNACSILYAAAWRAAQALGYWRILTYTLPDEGGASLKAAGWVCVGLCGGGTWKRPNQGRGDRKDDWPLDQKWRWEATTHKPVIRFRYAAAAETVAGLFDATEE